MVFLNICDVSACGNIITEANKTSQYCHNHKSIIGTAAPGQLRSQVFKYSAGDGVFSQMSSEEFSGAGFKIIDRNIVISECCQKQINASNWDFKKSAWENHKAMNPDCSKIKESEGYLADVNNRYRTFECPIDVRPSYAGLGINYTDLAEAGFFYQHGDCVQCYACSISLENWENNDIPKIEHLRHSRQCPYVKNIIEPHLTQPEKDALKKIEKFELIEQNTKLLTECIVRDNTHSGPIAQRLSKFTMEELAKPRQTKAEAFAKHLINELRTVATAASNVDQFRISIIERVLDVSSHILTNIENYISLKDILASKKIPFIEVIKEHRNYREELQRINFRATFGAIALIPDGSLWDRTQQPLYITNNQNFTDISSKFTELLNQDFFTENTTEFVLGRRIVEYHIKKHTANINAAYELAIKYKLMCYHSNHMCFIKFLHDSLIPMSMNPLPPGGFVPGTWNFL